MHARAIAVSLLASLSGLFVAGTMPAHASASGSGFFISPVWVMTNDHVVEGCARVEVAGHGAARDILRDRDLDLAVLRVAQPFPGQALPFRSTRPRLAEAVHVLGYPLSDVLSPSVRVTSGSVSSITAFAEGDGLIQVSAPVQPGNSGGPMLDGFGQIVGVVVGRLNRDGAQNVNFAVSGEVAQDFLRQRGIDFKTSAQSRPDDTPEDLPDMVERAAEATVQVICHGAAAPSRTPGTAPAPAATGDLVIARGKDIVGYDYQFLRNVSLSQCHDACLADRRCRAFTYNTRHSACFLKDDGALLVNNADAVSGHARSLAAGLLDTGFTVTADVDSPGGDYLRIRQSSFIGCLAECGIDRRCRAFAYVRQTRDCWLKDRVGRVQRMPGVEFGVR